MKLVTANGKELKIVIDPKTSHYKIQFASGGELPDSLSGLYTSSEKATIAAINYVAISKVKAESIKEKQKTSNNKEV